MVRFTPHPISRLAPRTSTNLLPCFAKGPCAFPTRLIHPRPTLKHGFTSITSNNPRNRINSPLLRLYCREQRKTRTNSPPAWPRRSASTRRMTTHTRAGACVCAPLRPAPSTKSRGSAHTTASVPIPSSSTFLCMYAASSTTTWNYRLSRQQRCAQVSICRVARLRRKWIERLPSE
jgi:hypothetical protein